MGGLVAALRANANDLFKRWLSSGVEDVGELGRTSKTTCSDQLQDNRSQGRSLKALVTPLVTEFGHNTRAIKLWAMSTKQKILAASGSRAALTLAVLAALGSEESS